MRDLEFPEIGYSSQLNLVKLLSHAATIHSRGEIAYRGLIQQNYAQEFERCKCFSSALKNLGVKRGSKVITFEWNTHRHFEMYFAIPCMGAIMHLGNPFLTPEQIVYLVNRAEDEVLVFNEELTPLIESISGKLTTIKHYIVLSDSGEKPHTRLQPLWEYEELLGSGSPDYEYEDFDERTIASLTNTTGTTGDPKMCFFSHRQNVLHTLVWTIMLLGYSGMRGFDPRRDVMIPLVPMFHAHGWSLPYMATLLGCRQLYPGRFEPKAFLELLRKSKMPGQGAFMQCVPTMLDMIIFHPEIGEYEDYFKGVIYEAGGARLPMRLAYRAKELGIDLCAGWGMTEIYTKVALQFLKPHMFNWPEESKLDFLTRTGMAVPFVEQRVVDEQGKDVSKDDKAIGEIVLRAPWLTAGYYKDPDKSRELWRDGWLHTGDLARIDEEESILMADRNKDAIKSGGEWISSLTLESLLSTHHKVREAAVVGAKSEKWGERPIAFIVTEDRVWATNSHGELREHLLQYVADGKIMKWWIPDKFIIVGEIPRTSVGKLDKKRMRVDYGEVLEEVV